MNFDLSVDLEVGIHLDAWPGTADAASELKGLAAWQSDARGNGTASALRDGVELPATLNLRRHLCRELVAGFKRSGSISFDRPSDKILRRGGNRKE